MGRRKIEIKAIKDDRNRSVTFLKRKGGLFKKAHELSVLCSVDVAVFIFGTNKKLYEYSSGDMRELITRYTYHGGPTEHKGPSDFNGGADEDEDEDENGTPPHTEPMDGSHMLPPHFQGQQPFPPHIRHHTPSASPPIPNGVTFAQHAHAVQRGHTPQPQIGSRPGSRNDMRRMGPMMAQPVGPPHPPPQGPPVNGFAFVPQPAIYTGQNPTTMPPHMPPQMAPGPQYPFPPPQPHAHQMQPYMEDQRRSSMPPSFPPQGPPQVPQVQRHSVSPPQPHTQQLPQLTGQPVQHPLPHPHPSPPQPQHHHMGSPPLPPVIHEPPQQPPQSQPQQQPAPPAPVEVKLEPVQERIPQGSLLDTAVKKLPRQKQHSIFTPIDENRSVLSQHLATFHAEPQKIENTPPHRSSSIDGGSVPRPSGPGSSPPLPKRTDTLPKPRGSVSSIPETTFTPPSRSNSLRVGGPRPRLTVQIPDEASDDNSATAESASSPRGGQSTDATSQSTRRATDSHSGGMVLPPPSPSASALLSAGATGPPNPFARPPPQQPGQPNGPGGTAMNIDTPVSGLPSRFLNGEFLPSPSSFYPEWNFRGNDSNTLPSPLNFATPVVGSGPSFLRDEHSGGNHGTAAIPGANKRKSPELSILHHPRSEALDAGNEPKRVKVDS